TDNFTTTIGGADSNNITVSPTSTTTYYARIVGPAPCADVSATVASATLTVTEPSTAPTEVLASLDSICNGSPVTITADGTLGTAPVSDESTDNFTTTIGGADSNNITVSPTSTSTY